MFHDWWMAHRLEVYGALVAIPIIGGFAFLVGWLDARRDRRKK